MALNLKSIGEKVGPFTREYEPKDAILYALGVGAGFHDLEYCYEKNLKVLPSFSIASIFDTIAEFAIKAQVNIGGILHGEQDLIFHNPIPPEGTLTTNGQIDNIYDKGKDKGALVIGRSDTFHSNGEKLFTSIFSLFCRLDGGFDGDKSLETKFEFPKKEPDFIVKDTPLTVQPLLYRLSGDIFPLHADPKFAEASGFKKPIMHGLCTHGFACRALLNQLIPNALEKARRMKCRFSNTLYPGVPIETLIWKIEEGKAVWKTINSETKEEIITNGLFEYGDIPKNEIRFKDEIRFDDRIAVITGAGAGLGRIYALELAKRGAKIVVNDYGGAFDGSGKGSSSPAQMVVDEIKKAGGQAVPNYDNVASPEGGKNIIKTALDEFGTIDILINNAGILRDKSIVKMKPEQWQSVLDVHLSGSYNVTRPAFKIMKEKGYGRIIMTTSAAGLYGNFGQTNYSAAKLGVVGMMNTLKLEGAKYDIMINTIAPIAASRLTKNIMPPELFEKSKPEFVSPMVVYLCSDDCNETGQIFNAGMGFFNRAAILTGKGLQIGNPKNPPTPEMIHANFDKINNMENAQEITDATNAVLSILELTSDKKETSTENSMGSALDPAVIFNNMLVGFNKEAAKDVDVIFQFNIKGEKGGDWIVKVKNSTCNIQKGNSLNPDCTLTISDDNFVKLFTGAMTSMQAFTSGKLSLDGDIMKSQLIERLFNLNS